MCVPALSVADVAVDEGGGDLLEGLQDLVAAHQDLGGQGQDAGLQLLRRTRENRGSKDTFSVKDQDACVRGPSRALMDQKRGEHVAKAHVGKSTQALPVVTGFNARKLL